MSDTRQHPDVFTGAEALEYLRVAGDGNERTLQTLRESHDLASFQIGRTTLYHRSVLDGLILRLAGVNAAAVSRGERQVQDGSAGERIRTVLHGK